MIIKPQDYPTIDFSRYERVFAFGCSFTQYKWASWAEIIHTQSPNASFDNLGKSGAGNSYIATQISQHNQLRRFDETDLILVMWTTFMREDRYVNRDWITPGNIFTQSTYSDEYVKNYADTRGYLIRDLAIIDNTSSMLDNSKAHAINLMSVPAEYQKEKECSDVIDLYSDMLKIFPTPFHTFMGDWGCGHRYYDPNNKLHNSNELFKDYHPNAIQHHDYVKSLGIPLNEHAWSFAKESKELCDTYEYVHQFRPCQPVHIL